jgi:hypothetical protein
LEKIPQGESNLFDWIDLPSSETLAELFDGNVDIDDFVGARQEGVRDGFLYAHSDKSLDDVVEALEVLNVKRGDDVDLRPEQRLYILVTLV